MEIIDTLSSGIGMIRKGLNRSKRLGQQRRRRNLPGRTRTGASNAIIRSTACSAGLTSGGNRGFSNLPHHNLTYTFVSPYSGGSASQGQYKASLKIQPFKWLISSAYKYMADIYEKARVNWYTITIYFPTANPIARSSAASWLARDSTAVTGNDSYLGILQQPGHQRGRERTRFRFRWRPVEPDDFNYRELASAFDEFDWGTLLYSVVSDTNFTSIVPAIEFSCSMSFANIKEPVQEDESYLFAGVPAPQSGQEDIHWEQVQVSRPMTPSSGFSRMRVR